MSAQFHVSKEAKSRFTQMFVQPQYVLLSRYKNLLYFHNYFCNI